MRDVKDHGKYRVVEMKNGDFRIQRCIAGDWLVRQDLFEFATAAAAHTVMKYQIGKDQALQDSLTVKRIVKFDKLGYEVIKGT